MLHAGQNKLSIVIQEVGSVGSTFHLPPSAMQLIQEFVFALGHDGILALGSSYYLGGLLS